jgi:hypothetical protein
MKKLRVILTVFVALTLAMVFPWNIFVQTTIFNISAGASTATIQSTLNTAAGTSGNVIVNLAAGNYSITSQVTIPCPAGTMTIQGPAVAYRPPSDLRAASYSYTTPYTANLNGSITNTWGFTLGACTAGHGVTIQYTNWDGGQPSGGGGGFLFVTRGNHDFTYQYNFCHGLWASTTSGHDYDTCVYLDGGLEHNSITTNPTFLWDVFGDGATDCNPIMNLTTYQGGSYDSSGGQCAGITWRASTTNLLISHTDFEHLEQAGKGIETGQSLASAVFMNNAKILYSDFGQIHRIGVEIQQFIVASQSVGSTFTFQYNTTHDTLNGAYGSWVMSFPNCCGGYLGISSDEEETIDDNTFAANAPPTGSYYPPIEWWGAGGAAGHGNNNLGQGFLGASTSDHVTYHGGSILSWGCTNPSSTPVWQAGNNILRQAYGGAVISDEGEQDPGKQCPTSPKVPPTQSNNSVIASLASQPSTVPAISPTPTGTYSANIAVTITNAGNVSGQGPRGNQNSFCTLDGSTPTVNSTFYASGTVVSVSPGTTVKCIGMWGAQNQPHVWPSNFGWAQSAMTSATYASGTVTVTLASVSITNVGGRTSLPIGGTNAFSARCTYSDSTQTTCSGTADSHGNLAAFVSTNATVGSIDATTGIFTALTTGNTLVTASVNGMLATTGTTVAVQNIENALTNWLSVCFIGSCGGGSPGGTNAPASTQQTVNNSSPAGAPSGTSMLLSQTTLTTSTQTNVLWRYQAVSTCDLCTVFSTSSSFYLGSNSAKATAFEFDDNDFDQTESLQLTFGHQCNQSNGLWQIDNGTRSWVNTAIPCSLGYSAWHTLITNGHRILGDTSCGGKPTLYFDSIVIDGVTDQIDQTLCATALPGGTTAALLTQFQIDVGATTAAQTVTMNLDNVNFTATNGFLTLVQNLLTGKPIGFRGGWVR